METFIVDDTYTMPTPGIDVEYTEEDLQLRAKRDDSGKMHKKTVRWGLRRIDLTWPVLGASQINRIRNAVKGKEYVKLQYYSTQAGINGVINECYTGNLTYKLHTTAPDIGEIWTDVKLSFIER